MLQSERPLPETLLCVRNCPWSLSIWHSLFQIPLTLTDDPETGEEEPVAHSWERDRGYTSTVLPGVYSIFLLPQSPQGLQAEVAVDGCHQPNQGNREANPLSLVELGSGDSGLMRHVPFRARVCLPCPPLPTPLGPLCPSCCCSQMIERLFGYLHLAFASFPD